MADVVGIIAPNSPTYLSQFEEGLGDEFDFMIAVLNLSNSKRNVA